MWPTELKKFFQAWCNLMSPIFVLFLAISRKYAISASEARINFRDLSNFRGIKRLRFCPQIAKFLNFVLQRFLI